MLLVLSLILESKFAGGLERDSLASVCQDWSGSHLMKNKSSH